MSRPAGSADLYRIPPGAGGRSVRFNGRIFEAFEAARRHLGRWRLFVARRAGRRDALMAVA